MDKRLYSYTEITDLKDMLNKTKDMYGNRPAYKIKVVEEKSPLHRNVTTEQVGNVTTFLLSNMSDAITGQVIYADSGYNIMGV